MAQEVIYTPEEIAELKWRLRYDRFKLGIANLLFSGEESSLAMLKTIIIRELNGNDRHYGILGSFSAAASMIQFLGMPILRHYRSNYRAMRAALAVGVVVGVLVAGSILLGFRPEWHTPAIWIFLFWSLIMAMATGVQTNIETNWIGDMVPAPIRGWFTSAKYMVTVLGMAGMSLGFGWIVDKNPGSLLVYAMLYLLVSVSHIAAILLAGTLPDREPENANFVGGDRRDRLNYFSPALWSYILFFIFWSGGRTAQGCFTAIYMIEHFQYGMIQVALLGMVTTASSLVMLFLLGRWTDRWGNRVPLVIVSAIVSLSMFSWLASAWWGVVPLVAGNVIAGLAGSTHSMLVNNYGLEIFPAKGRAGYFGFSRVVLGAGCIAAALLAGYIAHELKGGAWSFELWGVTLTRYHLIFTICPLFTVCCVIPLLLIGKQVVRPAE